MDPIPPAPPLSTPPVAPLPEPRSKVWVWVLGGILLLGVGVTVGLFLGNGSKKTMSSYEECVQAKGSIVAKSYPGICITSSGQRFTQSLTDEEKQNLQPPDPTADWKTYTNNIYGVSFKYPSDATFCQDVDGVRFAKFEDPKLTCKTDPISVQNLLRLSKKPIGQTYNLYQEWEKTNALKVFKKEKSILAGKEVMTFSGMHNGNAIRFKIVIIPIGEDDIILNFEGDEENDPRWDQILSTFKFLGQNISWQNYSNKKLGFSVDYPSGWRVVESGGAISAVGFGPKEIPEDVLWGVTIYDKSQTSKEKVINETGNQFSDRKQDSEIVNLNGIQATKLTTTTLSHTDWYLETIIVETNTKIYAISNGAISDTTLGSTKGVPNGVTFENFYSTFKLTN